MGGHAVAHSAPLSEGGAQLADWENDNVASVVDEVTEYFAGEEAEAARGRGLRFAERHQFDLALDEFRRALALSDGLEGEAWPGGTWEHREQLAVDILALENRGGGER